MYSNKDSTGYTGRVNHKSPKGDTDEIIIQYQLKF
jgi:hypothetical protein